MLDQGLILFIGEGGQVKVIVAHLAFGLYFQLIPANEDLIQQDDNIISFPFYTSAALVGAKKRLVPGVSLNDEAIHPKGRRFVTTQGDDDVVAVF